MRAAKKAEKAERAAQEAKAARENRDQIIKTYEWVGERFRARYADQPVLLKSLLDQNDLAIKELRRSW